MLTHASRQLHAQLLAAIETLSPLPDGAATGTTADSAALVAWADVLVRDLSLVSNRLDACAADDSSYADSMTSLEEAWWRIAAARVKIGAMLTMALGLPALRIEKNQIRFKPDEKRLLRQLRKIGEHDPDALRLVAALESIMPAKDMRNLKGTSIPIRHAATGSYSQIRPPRTSMRRTFGTSGTNSRSATPAGVRR